MNASGGGSKLLALDTSRVRVDARLLSPLPASNKEDATYRVVIAVAPSKEEAEENDKEIRKLTGEDTDTVYDTETKTWSLVL
jgi:hypothetical protein